MSADGFYILPEQCQRKWINLSEGFLHYQAEAEASGVPPKWPFFSRVRHVVNTLNVPITGKNNFKFLNYFYQVRIRVMLLCYGVNLSEE